jgi:hypothetical protein
MLKLISNLIKRSELPNPSPRHKYSLHSGSWSICIYCGERATCRDHVLPVSIAEAMPSIVWPLEILRIVPSCTRCNSIAGAGIFTTIQSKRNFILQRIADRIIRFTLREAIRNAELSWCKCEPGVMCVKVRAAK